MTRANSQSARGIAVGPALQALLAVLVWLGSSAPARGQIGPFPQKPPTASGGAPRIHIDPRAKAPEDLPSMNQARTQESFRACDRLAPLSPEAEIAQWVDEIRRDLDPSTPCKVVLKDEHPWVQTRYAGAELGRWLDRARSFVEDRPVVLTLRPQGFGQVLVLAHVSDSGQHGIQWKGPTSVQVTGRVRPGDSLPRLQNFLHLAAIDPELGFYDARIQQTLGLLGYVGHWSWNQAGEFVLVVHPGHLIRNISVSGNFPVKRRDVVAQLPANARPGQLSPLRCLSKRDLHKLSPCASGDESCETWRDDVAARVVQQFVERGYLKAQASIALVCKSTTRQATLEVDIQKNGLYRIDPQRIRFLGQAAKLPEPFLRQIRREVSGMMLPGDESALSTPATATRLDAIADKLRRELSEPGRAFGSYFRPGQRPHPSARLKFSLNLREPARHRRIALDVHAELGPGLVTQFFPKDPKAGALDFRTAQLERQLQLYSRKEAPSQVVADSEASNLRAFYQSRAYPLATVQGAFTDFVSLQRMAFAIDEGPSARVARIEVLRPPKVQPKVARDIELEWNQERAISEAGAFSDGKALEDLGRLTEAYRAKGYPCASAQLRLAFWPEGLDTPGAYATLDASSLLQGGGVPGWISDFNEDGMAALRKMRRTKLYLQYRVTPGPRLLAQQPAQIHYLKRSPGLESPTQVPSGDQGQWGARRILYGTSLQPNPKNQDGLALHSELQRSASVEIASKYRAAGYPLASASVFWGVRSSPDDSWTMVRELRELADPKRGICHRQDVGALLQARPEIFVYEGKRGEFGDTVFRGNFKTRTRTLQRELSYNAGDRFESDKLEDSLRSIESLGVFDRMDLTPLPSDCEQQDQGRCVVHHAVQVQESSDYFMDLRYGFGAATLNPLYFFVQPTIPNIGGTAWRLRGDFSYGFDVVDNQNPNRLNICDGADCYERRAFASLSRAHLPGVRVGVNLGTQYQVRKTPARGLVSTINVTARLTWRLSRGRFFYTGYRFQRANLSEDLVKPLGGSQGSWVNRSLATVRDNTGMVEGGVQIQRVDNPFNPSRGYIANADLAFASKYLGGKDHWAKIDLSWQHFVPLPILSDRWQFRYALRYGQIFPIEGLGTRTAPKIWRYYGGGSFDLGLRGMRPETMLLDLERIPTPSGGAILRAKAQGGHLRLLSTLALEFASVRNLFGGTLSHSLFYDSGYLLQSFAGAHLGRDYRHSVGLNFLKLDINLASLALGYALLLPPNVTDYDDRNGRFVFDVGITF